MKVVYFEQDNDTILVIQMLFKTQFQKWKFTVGKQALLFEVEARE